MKCFHAKRGAGELVFHSESIIIKDCFCVFKIIEGWSYDTFYISSGSVSWYLGNSWINLNWRHDSSYFTGKHCLIFSSEFSKNCTKLKDWESIHLIRTMYTICFSCFRSIRLQSCISNMFLRIMNNLALFDSSRSSSNNWNVLWFIRPTGNLEPIAWNVYTSFVLWNAINSFEKSFPHFFS